MPTFLGFTRYYALWAYVRYLCVGSEEEEEEEEEELPPPGEEAEAEEEKGPFLSSFFIISPFYGCWPGLRISLPLSLGLLFACPLLEKRRDCERERERESKVKVRTRFFPLLYNHLWPGSNNDEREREREIEMKKKRHAHRTHAYICTYNVYNAHTHTSQSLNYFCYCLSDKRDRE